MKSKNIYFTVILLLVGCFLVVAQEFDITTNVVESGTKSYQARNSIIFESGYTYTPNGGTLLAEIVNPLVIGTISYSSIIDPETRTLNTTYLTGTTNGIFNVNALGSAGYTIPIELMPGIGGLQPNLAITYNIFTGSGVAGQGWSISGLSAITRSSKTYYYDAAFAGVNLSTTDRFSLDGQRLVCTSGTYGTNGSVYRTENDIFSKVTCYTGSYGPDKFEVKTKGGLTYQYGYNNDADQTVYGHNETLNWLVNRITDVYGNNIDFTYLKNEGFNYVADITYGANTISFFYKQRSDIKTFYLKGKPMRQQLLLDKIEVKYNSTVVKKYEFKYNYYATNYNPYSTLNEVIEYGIGASRYNSTALPTRHRMQ